MVHKTQCNWFGFQRTHSRICRFYNDFGITTQSNAVHASRVIENARWNVQIHIQNILSKLVPCISFRVWHTHTDTHTRENKTQHLTHKTHSIEWKKLFNWTVVGIVEGKSGERERVLISCDTLTRLCPWRDEMLHLGSFFYIMFPFQFYRLFLESYFFFSLSLSIALFLSLFFSFAHFQSHLLWPAILSACSKRKPRKFYVYENNNNRRKKRHWNKTNAEVIKQR